MNIHAKRGTIIVFNHPNAGLPHEQEEARRKLDVNSIYTVERTDVHSFKTYVYLQEIPGIPFNSVLFEEEK